jgi:hypothetical protein
MLTEAESHDREKVAKRLKMILHEWPTLRDFVDQHHRR